MRFKLITNYKNKEHDFKNEPLRHLMKSCDDESRRVLETIKNRTEDSKMVKFRKWIPLINYREMYRLVSKAIRIIDAIDSEKQCLFDNQPQQYDLIYSEVRNVFSQGLAAAALKFTLGFNTHGERDCAINRNVIGSSYPRCS